MTEKCMQKHQDATRKHVYIFQQHNPLQNAVTAVVCSTWCVTPAKQSPSSKYDMFTYFSMNLSADVL